MKKAINNLLQRLLISLIIIPLILFAVLAVCKHELTHETMFNMFASGMIMLFAALGITLIMFND